MLVFRDIKQWRRKRTNLQQGKSLGVVMTMGALHRGHLELVKQSQADNDLTLVTLFVNPTQFNAREDLDSYPHTFEEDMRLLKAEGVDFLFSPDYRAIYPDDYRYKLSETQFSKQLCGGSRPGHFDGVLTVVMKLLQLAQADRAYFGLKDYQQFKLIKGMAEAFFLSTDIIGVEIIRDEEGLALSSRNLRLSEAGLKQARQFAACFKQNKSLAEIRREIRKLEVEIDYLSDYEDRRFVAVWIEGVRLIDNMALDAALIKKEAGKNETNTVEI
ncbi:MAG: pantoate--beta-alanine ligase [Francisellaceae bacterium]